MKFVPVTTLNNLRKEMKAIDEIENEAELPKLIQELKNEFYDLEALIKKVKDLGDDEGIDIAKMEQHVAELKTGIEQAIKSKDKKAMSELIGKISNLDFAIRDTLAGLQMDINFLQSLDRDFNSTNWKNAHQARELINRGLQMAADNNPSKQALRQLVIQILDLREDGEAISDRLKRER